MSTVKLELTAEAVAALRLPRGEEQSRLRRELAVRLYEKGLLSFGKAREVAGLTKWEFHELLGTENITRRYDVDDLQQDLRTLESLG
jgi:predicted HTH domain antitoxin